MINTKQVKSKRKATCARGVLGGVTFEGNETNTRAELLTFLGIEEGMELDRELLEDIELKLWKCGRFIRSHLDWNRRGTNSPEVDLAIHLVENPFAPSVSAALTPLQSSMLALCRWLTSYGEGEDEGEIFNYLSGERKYNMKYDIGLDISICKGSGATDIFDTLLLR